MLSGETTTTVTRWRKVQKTVWGVGIFHQNTDCQNIWSRVIKIEMILHFEEHLCTTLCEGVFIPTHNNISIKKKDLDSLEIFFGVVYVLRYETDLFGIIFLSRKQLLDLLTRHI